VGGRHHWHVGGLGCCDVLCGVLWGVGCGVRGAVCAVHGRYCALLGACVGARREDKATEVLAEMEAKAIVVAELPVLMAVCDRQQ
jgi:pentatricopeptide repeat protein